MAKRRFTSPISNIVSAPRQMDTFGNLHKRADGWYFPINDGKGGSKWLKGASLDFKLTDIGVAYTVRSSFTDLTQTMIAIAFAESGGDAVIIGGPNGDGTCDYGLFQINSSHAGAMGQLNAWWDPRANVTMARMLYMEARQRKGNVEDALREQWSSYKSGASAVQMNRAAAALATVGGALDAGSVTEVPLVKVIEDITDPGNPEGIAPVIDDKVKSALGGVLGELAPVGYIAGGAIILLLGVVLIMKAQGKK